MVRSGGLLFSCWYGLGCRAAVSAKAGTTVVPEIRPAAMRVIATRRPATIARRADTGPRAHANSSVAGFTATAFALCGDTIPTSPCSMSRGYRDRHISQKSVATLAVDSKLDCHALVARL